LAWVGQQKTWATKKAHEGPLVKRQSRETGLCPVRRWREKYEEAVDQLLRPWGFVGRKLGDDDAEVNLARRETLIRQTVPLS
jgi:hypothetical protein